VEGLRLKFLLDSAVWINGVTMPEVLPQRIRRLIQTEELKGLCSISLLETAILYRLGRLQFDGSLADFFATGLSSESTGSYWKPVFGAAG